MFFPECRFCVIYGADELMIPVVIAFLALPIQSRRTRMTELANG